MLHIRLIEREDNKAVARIIKEVLESFGANKEGFASKDPETDQMFETYQKPGTAYYVAMLDDAVVGGAGIGKLKGGTDHICELQKMYLLPLSRGKGIGKALMEKCLEFARSMGYDQCYIETLDSMHVAKTLYAKYGFKALSNPLGETGHYGCNTWLLKDLHE